MRKKLIKLVLFGAELWHELKKFQRHYLSRALMEKEDKKSMAKVQDTAHSYTMKEDVWKSCGRNILRQDIVLPET
jgi:hypothetical protein